MRLNYEIMIKIDINPFNLFHSIPQPYTRREFNFAIPRLRNDGSGAVEVPPGPWRPTFFFGTMAVLCSQT